MDAFSQRTLSLDKQLEAVTEKVKQLDDLATQTAKYQDLDHLRPILYYYSHPTPLSVPTCDDQPRIHPPGHGQDKHAPQHAPARAVTITPPGPEPIA